KTQFFDANQSSSSISDIQDVSLKSKTNDQSPTKQTSDTDSIVLSIPPPPSIINRSANAPFISLGISATPRGSVSNKIAPAAISSSSLSSVDVKQTFSASFRPISNTRYNPGRSPKLKTRSQQSRSTMKHQQQPVQSTIVELEPPIQKDTTDKSVPLLSMSSSTTATTTKSGSY
ncbi:unnamed protein product, partial [Adineta steineri]